LIFLWNFGVTLIIVRFIYYPSRRDKDYVFTYLAFNVVTFLVSSLLLSAELSMGFGLGLFAVFSVLRYRTDPIPIRDLTYLFVIMAFPVVNAILVGQEQWATLFVANFSLVLVLYVAEKGWGFQYEISKTITYEKIDLIRPENRHLLLEDLQKRTGLTITRLEIDRINFLRDTAEIKVYLTNPPVFSASDQQGEPNSAQILVAERDQWQEQKSNGR
jgi:hypothetical protein